MTGSTFPKRTLLIVPMVLLIVVVFEELAIYKVRQHVKDLEIRAAIILVLQGVGFTIGAMYVAPWLKSVLVSARRGSRWTGGKFGIWLFYIFAYGALYFVFLELERHGPAGLLPASLR